MKGQGKTDMNNIKNGNLNKYRRIGDLSMNKLMEFLPATIMNSLSTLLLISIDGLMVGNFMGEEALAAVSVFSPLTTLIGAFTVLVSYGISTSLSTSIGKNEDAQIRQIKGASFWLMVYLAVVATIIQIPIVWVLMKAYRLPDDIYTLAWQYAFGIMIATPLGLISSVGANMLQIVGKMKLLIKLTVMEGSINLVLDLVFVGMLQMGTAGAGLGTACANLVRCSTTVIYLLKYTDMLNYRRYRNTFAEYISILRLGVPDSVYSLVYAFQNYCMMQILLLVFAEDAGTVDGVCVFCFSTVNVLISGILAAMRPLVGLLTGAGDRTGLKILMRQGAWLMALMVGAATAVVELFPRFFYAIHGVDEFPQGAMAAVRINALFFLPYAFSVYLLIFLVNKKDSQYTTKITLAGNISQPVFALGLMFILSPPWVYLSKSITSVLVLILYWRRLKHVSAVDMAETENIGDVVLYMSVRKEEAVEASRAIRSYAEECGIDPKISYRIALCMEEMVAYIESVNEKKIAAQIIVRFRESGEAVFVIMDNGKCIALQKEQEQQKGLSTDNFVLMQRLAKSIKYEYVLDMNYTILEFE